MAVDIKNLLEQENKETSSEKKERERLQKQQAFAKVAGQGTRSGLVGQAWDHLKKRGVSDQDAAAIIRQNLLPKVFPEIRTPPPPSRPQAPRMYEQPTPPRQPSLEQPEKEERKSRLTDALKRLVGEPRQSDYSIPKPQTTTPPVKETRTREFVERLPEYLKQRAAEEEGKRKQEAPTLTPDMQNILAGTTQPSTTETLSPEAQLALALMEQRKQLGNSYSTLVNQGRQGDYDTPSEAYMETARNIDTIRSNMGKPRSVLQPEQAHLSEPSPTAQKLAETLGFAVQGAAKGVWLPQAVQVLNRVTGNTAEVPQGEQQRQMGLETAPVTRAYAEREALTGQPAPRLPTRNEQWLMVAETPLQKGAEEVGKLLSQLAVFSGIAKGIGAGVSRVSPNQLQPLAKAATTPVRRILDTAAKTAGLAGASSLTFEALNQAIRAAAGEDTEGALNELNKAGYTGLATGAIMGAVMQAIPEAQFKLEQLRAGKAIAPIKYFGNSQEVMSEIARLKEQGWVEVRPGMFRSPDANIFSTIRVSYQGQEMPLYDLLKMTGGSVPQGTTVTSTLPGYGFYNPATQAATAPAAQTTSPAALTTTTFAGALPAPTSGKAIPIPPSVIPSGEAIALPGRMATQADMQGEKLTFPTKEELIKMTKGMTKEEFRKGIKEAPATGEYTPTHVLKGAGGFQREVQVLEETPSIVRWKDEKGLIANTPRNLVKELEPITVSQKETVQTTVSETQPEKKTMQQKEKQEWELTLSEFAKEKKQDLNTIMNDIWGTWQGQKLMGERKALPYGISNTKQLYNKIKDDLLKDPSGAKLVKVGNKEYVVADYEHKNIVKNALSEGKPVPPEVLKDYPDLQITPQEGVSSWEEQGHDLYQTENTYKAYMPAKGNRSGRFDTIANFNYYKNKADAQKAMEELRVEEGGVWRVKEVPADTLGKFRPEDRTGELPGTWESQTQQAELSLEPLTKNEKLKPIAESIKEAMPRLRQATDDYDIIPDLEEAVGKLGNVESIEEYLSAAEGKQETVANQLIQYMNELEPEQFKRVLSVYPEATKAIASMEVKPTKSEILEAITNKIDDLVDRCIREG